MVLHMDYVLGDRIEDVVIRVDRVKLVWDVMG
jgi:hypothetical protein